eukprot:GEMP01040434.1.p1 GENE.GEMP01040434.1~~GEMP01040434.1.p1  ORF type:complete len:425 (+),score=37.55 GEMP01040434.1:309-1583(+)
MASLAEGCVGAVGYGCPVEPFKSQPRKSASEARIPLYILALHFRVKHAIPLSNCTIFGGAVANTLFNLRKRHPSKPQESSIDWDIILMMEPATILGAVIGSFLSKLLPSIVLTFFLSIILFFMARRTLSKARKMWREESRSLQTIGISDTSTVATTTELQDVFVRMDDTYGCASPEQDADDPEGRMLAPDTQPSFSSRQKVMAFFPLFAGTLILTVIRGGGSFHPFFECGSVGFWIVSLANIPLAFYYCWKFRNMLLRQHDDRERRNVGYGEYEIRWDKDTTIRYPAICSIAGLFAGLFGVGGGIVKGPLMLEMGVQPQVASATAATMILLTSATASVSFLLFGLVDIPYAIFLWFMGFACTAVGQVFLSRFMKRSNRQSPVIFSIGAVIALSSVVIMIETIVHNVSRPWDQIWAIHSLCSDSH